MNLARNSWRRSKLRQLVVAPVLFAMLGPATALADTPEPKPETNTADANQTNPNSPSTNTGPTDADKQEARRLYEKGVDLLGEEAFSAALDAFERSRGIYPTRGNTYNAAKCLRKLQRFDESLDLYEALLRDFTNLPSEDKLEAQKAVAELRDLVGTIDVTGAVPGAGIVIDGQNRGDFPPVTPIRVTVGAHIVRIIKEGYEPFETRVDVTGGQSERVVAKLSKLAASGRLKVIEQAGRNLDVLIDGSVVGQTPWEGLVAATKHVVILRGKGKTGTQPAAIDVPAQQIRTLQLRAEDLESSLRVEPSPINARVAIDGVTVGNGPWAGRMRTGSHRVEVAEDGFIGVTKTINLTVGKVEKVTVTLDRDDRAERWRKPSRWIIDATIGVPIASTLGGDVGESCAQGCDRSVGLGIRALARGGYELGWGLGFGVEAGYAAIFQSLDNRSASVVPVGLAPQPGTATDHVRLDGALVGASVWYRLGEKYPIGFRFAVGGLLGRVRDDRTGEFAARVSDNLKPPSLSDVQAARYLYFEPELSLGYRIGKHIDLAATMSVFFLYTPNEPRWDDQKSFYAGSDGVATYPNEKLTGNVIVVPMPALRLRYSL